MSHPIARGEFLPVDVFRCTGNPVVTENLIIKQVACGLPSGAEVVSYFGYGDKFGGGGSGDSVDVLSEWAPVLITVAILVFFQLLAFIFFLGRRQRSKRSRARKAKII